MVRVPASGAFDLYDGQAMKALVCETAGGVDQLVYRDFPDPKPKPNEVLVRVRAAGAIFTDILLAAGKYQERPDVPFVLGSEVAGVVAAVGSKVIRFRPGDRIASVSNHFSAFAEFIVLEDYLPARLPDGTSFETGAAWMSAYGTAQHALRQRAALKPGEALVVTGAAGGTGSAAVQAGRAIGAQVTAVCSTQDKADFALAHGAHNAIVLAQEDLPAGIKRLTLGKGADVVFDTVGGEAFEGCVKAMCPEGRILVVGFASGTVPALRIHKTLLGSFSVIGVHWTTWAARHPDAHIQNMDELSGWLQQGLITPLVDSTYPLSEGAKGLHRIADRKVMGKVVLVTEPSAA